MSLSLRETLYSEVIPYVDKPGRYTGGEYNSRVKSAEGLARVCLIYPDLYEIGISNIGLKILYDILNNDPAIACERSYAPWTDMEERLRAKGLPLFSLETATPLREFDVLGFSFQYEMVYTNFLNMLDMSGIPLYSGSRSETDPLIIGGGPITGNMEPVADFLDAICVGDGETRVLAMVRAVSEGRKAGHSRAQILKSLSHIDGVYVPSLYSTENVDGLIIPRGRKVRRHAEPDIDSIPFVTRQILPNVQAVQDRAVVEVTRGCTRGCRFCQAGYFYRPVRERSITTIISAARNAITATGYNDCSLISLSISDYSALVPLIKVMEEQFAPHGVSFSLPSLRLDSFTVDLAKSVREIRKSGLTFAVEGGGQDTRNCINKNVSSLELERVLTIARELGWKSVKLYFMVGLPHPDGVDEAGEIEKLVRELAGKNRGLSITVSVAVFIPKPHTPYQWEGQLTPETGRTVLYGLRDRFRGFRQVNVRTNDPEVSFLEGVFSRGDRALSRVIETAFRKGARFDGWGEKLRLETWKEAFADCGIDPSRYISRRPVGSPLPWDIIDPGVSPEYLLRELKASQKGESTPECRDTCSNSCGECDWNTLRPMLALGAVPQDILDPAFLSNIRIDAVPHTGMRFTYTKTGPSRFMSQIDLEEALSRAFYRANMPVAFTQGFNPKVKLEMGRALPVGFESLHELCQTELSREMDASEFMDRMNTILPEGVKITAARSFALPHPKLSRAIREEVVELTVNSGISQAELDKRLEAAGAYRKVTPNRESVIDMRESVISTKADGKTAVIESVIRDGGVRLQDLVQALLSMDAREAGARGAAVVRRRTRMEMILKDALFID